jgi:hypothetical protein
MFLFLLHASLSLLSHQACACSTLVGLRSFLTLCHRLSPAHRHHSHITPGPPPSQSICSRPPAVIVVTVTSPSALTMSSLCCSRPPTIVAVVVVTINLARCCFPHVIHSPPLLLPSWSHHPQSTAITLTLVVNGPPSSSSSRSHHPQSNQRHCQLTPVTAPRCSCCCGHITPSPLPLCSHCFLPPTKVVVAVTSPPANRHSAHIVHGLLSLPSRSHNPQLTSVALTLAGALSSSSAYRHCAEIVPGPAAITHT